MTHGTYFNQDCPTCGRALHIRVEYLGRELNCQHCRGKLMASDPDDANAVVKEGSSLIQRADVLLGRSQHIA